MKILRYILVAFIAVATTAFGQNAITQNNTTGQLMPVVKWVSFPPSKFRLLDTDSTHNLIINNGSNLAADRTFTITTTGDTNVTFPTTGTLLTEATGATQAMVNGYFADPSTNSSFSASAWQTDLSTIPGTNFSRKIATIAALKALSLSGLSSGYMVTVQDYATAGDGGGGPLRYLSTGQAPGTYVDNGGSIILPTGGDGSAAWLWAYSGDVNAKWFGAKGDGVTNDTTAIQAALTANPGKVIYLPDGTYSVPTTITIAGQGTTLRGASYGGGTRASQYTNAPYRGTVLLPAADINVLFINDDASGGAVEDLSIVWTQNDQNFLGIGIKLDPGLELFAVRRVLIVGQDRETGIYAEKEVQECIFDEVRTQNCFYGAHFPYDSGGFPASFMRFTNSKLGGLFGISHGGYVSYDNVSFQGAAIGMRIESDPNFVGSATGTARLNNCYFELSAGATSFPYNVFPNKLQRPCAFINGDTAGNSDILSGLVNPAITVQLTASGQQVTFDLVGGAWPKANIEPGMLLYIPAGSPYEGASGQNVGYYVIEANTSVSFSTTRLTAYKWWEAGGSAYSTAPVNVAATAATNITNLQHLRMFANVVMTGNGSANIYGSTLAVLSQADTPRCIVTSGAGAQVNIFGCGMADTYTCTNNTQLSIFGTGLPNSSRARFMNSAARAVEYFCNGGTATTMWPNNFPASIQIGNQFGQGIQVQAGSNLYSASGTPEAAVSANVGSLFMRTDGGATTAAYAKTSGTGNTGWLPLVTAPVAVSQGGTGQTTFTDGQLLIGNSTGNTLAKATLTGTANRVTVTNGSGSITLSGPQDIGTASTPTFGGVILAAGTESLPSLTWSGDATTGLYRDASNVIRMSIAGSRKFSLTAANLQLLYGTTSAASPSITINSGGNTGLFNPASGTIGFSSAGTEAANFTATAATFAGTLATQAAASVTTASAGVHAFDTDAWAASRGATQIYDGTANTYVVATLASDTPANGQSPMWNTGGTVTWETRNSSVVAAYRTGTATLVAGTVTVSDASTTANTRIRLSRVTPGGIVGAVDLTAKSNGVSFTLTSSSAGDTSTIYYEAFEP